MLASACCKTDFLCTLLPASLVREMVQHVDIECCRQHSMKALVCYLHSILFAHNLDHKNNCAGRNIGFSNEHPR